MNRDFQDIASMRKHYESDELLESNTPENPFELFQLWFTAAKNSSIHEANAMILATADQNGKPSARVVLLKDLTPQNDFVFYTNYLSRKGQDIEQNKQVSLLFFWDMLERQVRIEGEISKVDEASCDAYFKSRPIGSQIGAVISPQSQPIANKEVLQDLYNQEAAKNATIERPLHWGGYGVKANKIEYWQGRPNRLHDRIVYEIRENKWLKYRVAP